MRCLCIYYFVSTISTTSTISTRIGSLLPAWPTGRPDGLQKSTQGPSGISGQTMTNLRTEKEKDAARSPDFHKGIMTETSIPRLFPDSILPNPGNLANNCTFTVPQNPRYCPTKPPLLSHKTPTTVPPNPHYCPTKPPLLSHKTPTTVTQNPRYCHTKPPLL